MTDEEQKAWDMFAAAALGVYCLGIPSEKTGTDQTIGQWRAIQAAEQADAMMEQRKARMG